MNYNNKNGENSSNPKRMLGNRRMLFLKKALKPLKKAV